MKRLFPLLLVCFSLAANAQQNPAPHFEWMCGKWMGEIDGGRFCEEWKKVDGQTFEGRGYFIEENDTVVKELLRIEKIGRHWVYIASINDGRPHLFTLVENSETTWSFENTEHDFPQKITYSAQPDGKLLATVEGASNGNHQQEKYLLEKVH